MVSFAWNLVTKHTTFDEIVLVIGQFKWVVEKQRVSLEHVTLNQGVNPKKKWLMQSTRTSPLHVHQLHRLKHV